MEEEGTQIQRDRLNGDELQFESPVYSRLIAFTYMVNSPWIVTSSRSTARCRV